METDTCLKSSDGKPISTNCCKKLCLFAFTPKERKAILKEMKDQGGYEERTKYLAGLMSNHDVKERKPDSRNLRRRDKTTKYCVRGMEVCRQSFRVLFQITHKRITILRRKLESGIYRKMSGRPKKIRSWRTLTNIGNIPEVNVNQKNETEFGLAEDSIVANNSPESLDHFEWQKNIKQEYQDDYDADEGEAIFQFEEEAVDFKIGMGNNMDVGKIPKDFFYGLKTKQGNREGESAAPELSIRIKEEIVSCASEDDLIGFEEGSEKKKKKKRKKDRGNIEKAVAGENTEGDDFIVAYEGETEDLKKHKKKKKKRKNRETLEEAVCEDIVGDEASVVIKNENFNGSVEDNFIVTDEGDTEDSKKHKKKKKNRKNREIVEEAVCGGNAEDDEGNVTTIDESCKSGVEDDFIVTYEGETQDSKKHKKKKKRKNREILEEAVCAGNAEDDEANVNIDESFKDTFQDDLIETHEGKTEASKKHKKKKKHKNLETFGGTACGENVELEAVSDEVTEVPKKKKKKKHQDISVFLTTEDDTVDDLGCKKKQKKRRDRESGEIMGKTNNEAGENGMVRWQPENNLLEGEDYRLENFSEAATKKKKKSRNVSRETSEFDHDLAVSEKSAIFDLQNFGKKKKKKKKKNQKDCECTEDLKGDEREITDNHCNDIQNNHLDNETETLLIKKKKKKKRAEKIVSEILENPFINLEPIKRKKCKKDKKESPLIDDEPKEKKKKSDVHESGDAVDDPILEVAEPKKKKKRKEEVIFGLLNDIWIV